MLKLVGHEVALTTDSRLDVGELYATHGRMVMRRVQRFFSTQEAEEVLHEVFVKVVERANTYRGEASPTTWLYNLATNHCINRKRDVGRRAQLWQQHVVPACTQHSTPDHDAALFLREFWQRLDEQVVRIGIYYFIDGMSHAQIADLVGCSRRTVGNRLEELSGQARAEAGLERRES